MRKIGPYFQPLNLSAWNIPETFGSIRHLQFDLEQVDTKFLLTKRCRPAGYFTHACLLWWECKRNQELKSIDVFKCLRHLAAT
jgi:hypothetical protein